MIAAVTIASVFLVHTPVTAQSRPSPAGCSAVPAEFHPCALSKAKTFTPPKTPEGQPDLQGLWTAPVPGAAQNIEPDPGDGGFFYAATRGLIVDPADGRVPYQPWAAAQRKVNEERFLDPYGYCFPTGVPNQMYILRTREITQTPSSIVILNEAGGHIFRIIQTDGRPHLGERVKLWMGDSRGRWEGNTLVVDVTNFNNKTWFDVRGNFHSDRMHVVERFTLVDRDTMHYQATMEDPDVFTRPWTIAVPLVRNKEPGYEQMEEACHEGNDDGKGGDRYMTPLLELGYKPFPGVTPPK